MKYLLVGYGNIGRKREAALGTRCVATVDPVNPGARYTHPDQCPPDRYEAAILSVPNEAKLPWMRYFLERGKSVLVEKPLLFPDRATAEAMESLARRGGAVWYTAYNHRFEPLVAEAKRRIDAGAIGTLYSARLFYGNGTVRHVAGTWREKGGGVLEDLGCHLVDLAGHLFGIRGQTIEAWERRSIESAGIDHCTLATADHRIVAECSYVSWRNCFTVEAFGERGSLHLQGLRKWGPCELTLRERVLPSGKPRETILRDEGPDETWTAELDHFERHVSEGRLSPENDRWLSDVLGSLVPAAAVEVSPAAPTGFVGLSHLGIVSSIAWASIGRPVVGYDPDADRVSALQRHDLPIHEPGLAEALRRHRDQIRFSADAEALKGCPLVFFALDVPTDNANRSNLAPIEELVLNVARHLSPGTVLVLMSQVPPGFSRSLAGRIRQALPGRNLEFLYLVETLIFGKALERATRPERLIVGTEDPSAPLPEAAAREWGRFGCPILRMRYESAELAKTAINIYLCAGVTYANTLSDLCEAIGADWSEILPALRLDARIGPSAYIAPSLGVAGGNLERDLVTVQQACRQAGVDASLVETILAYNSRRYQWALRKLEDRLFSLHPRPTLAVWGLAYKKDTHSTKNSMSLRVIAEIQERATVQAYDPKVKTLDPSWRVRMAPDRTSALEGADGLLIMTDWDEFRTADLGPVSERLKQPLVIDCVGVLAGRRGDLGRLRYCSMGRP